MSTSSIRCGSVEVRGTPNKPIRYSSIHMQSYPLRLSPRQVHTWRSETSLAWLTYSLLWREPNKLLSMGSKVNQSTGVTLQKNWPPSTGLRRSTLLTATHEDPNILQAAEHCRNAILQRTTTILVDQSLHFQSPKILPPSRGDTSPNSQYHEVERQYRLCCCAKGTEGSEKCGRRCQEG